MTHDAERPTMLSPEEHAITTQLAQWVVVGLSICVVTLFGAIVTLTPAAEKSELVRELVSKVGSAFQVAICAWVGAITLSFFYYIIVLDSRRKRASSPGKEIGASLLKKLLAAVKKPWAAVVSYLTLSWLLVVRGLLLVAAIAVVAKIAMGSWDLKIWLDGIAPPQP
ncbi:MAG: hypothetical protein QNJ84_01530 [Alphaproteobacteria bacterium]|nr:hypothetical protein [Alphaproteobacteria bacterium]